MRISDWSSDVCSSDLRLDLAQAPFGLVDMRVAGMYEKPGVGIPCEYFPVQIVRLAGFTLLGPADVRVVGHHGEAQRSEERRVGKERDRTCRSRWSPNDYKQK